MRYEKERHSMRFEMRSKNKDSMELIWGVKNRMRFYMEGKKTIV